MKFFKHKHKNKIAVVIVHHSNELNNFEIHSFMECLKVFKKRDIYLVLPIKLKDNTYIFNELAENKLINFVFLPDLFFKDVKHLNLFIQNNYLYYNIWKQKGYDYILNYELDVWPIRDELDYFASLGYDWIGAPMAFNDKDKGGNSGYNLRKIDTLLKFSNEVGPCIEHCDVYFSLWFYDKLKVAPFEVEAKFALERNPKEFYEKYGKHFPTAFHKPFYTHKDTNKYVTWDKDFNYNLMKEHGIDLEKIIEHKDFKIFICQYKPITNNLPEDKNHFILLQQTEIEENRLNKIVCNDEFTNNWKHTYCEVTQIHYLYTHQEIIKDINYIGINHDHRIFSCLNKSNNQYYINSIKTNIDNGYCYAGRLWVYDYDVLSNNKSALINDHGVDVNNLRKIIHKLYPKYIKEYDNMLKRNYIYNCNIFIMSKESFIKYCKFIFDILEEFSKSINVKNDIDIQQYCNDNINRYRSNDINWISRLHGYIAERLTDIWIRYNFKEKINIINCDIL